MIKEVKTCFTIGSLGFNICTPFQENCVKMIPTECDPTPPGPSPSPTPSPTPTPTPTPSPSPSSGSGGSAAGLTLEDLLTIIDSI
jgi:hypothetical protein